MASMPGQITLIVKVTSSCNLRCTYCYMDRARYVQIMDRATLERMTRGSSTGRAFDFESKR